MFKHVLIPTDGSPASQKAAARGVALAKAVGAKVTAVFAAPPATPVIYRDHLPVGFAQPAEHARMIDRMAAKHLDFVARAAKKARVPFDGVYVTSDFPDETILDVAAKRRCDVIVMATHGHSGLRGMLLGSVTQKILNRAKIPVLVLR
jgi:nucleotide-binding universal stress UspA family protein